MRVWRPGALLPCAGGSDGAVGDSGKMCPCRSGQRRMESEVLYEEKKNAVFFSDQSYMEWIQIYGCGYKLTTMGGTFLYKKISRT